MSSLSTEPTLTTCINHPERAAVESCEVCLSPLCAYCLYYTSDGQRLCKTHAEQAAAAGGFFFSPGTYTPQVIWAPLVAHRNPKPAPVGFHGGPRGFLALVGMGLRMGQGIVCR